MLSLQLLYFLPLCVNSADFPVAAITRMPTLKYGLVGFNQQEGSCSPDSASKAPWAHGPRGPMSPWAHVSMSPWAHGPMAHGPMSPWARGPWPMCPWADESMGLGPWAHHAAHGPFIWPMGPLFEGIQASLFVCVALLFRHA